MWFASKSANETSILDITVYKKVIKTLIKFLLFPTLKTEKFLLFPTLGSKFLLFRWFKFTLKPPYTVGHEKLLSLIWDTSQGIFFSNLDSRQLMTCPRTLFGQIWNMSLFGDSRAVRVLMPKYRGLRKSIFSRWRSGDSFLRLGGFRWADGWAIWWYHFRGGARHLGALVGLRIRRFCF